jgi:hypothetical protein
MQMISTIYAADGTAVALDLHDTVTYVLGPADRPTTRLVPPPRRPNADPERFERRRNLADVAASVELDELQQRFNRFAADVPPSGRHRSPDQPGLIARLRRLVGRGRRDGA